MSNVPATATLICTTYYPDIIQQIYFVLKYIENRHKKVSIEKHLKGKDRGYLWNC